MAILTRSNVGVSQLRSDAKVDEDFIPGGKLVNDGPAILGCRLRRAKVFLALVETHFQLQGMSRPSMASSPGGGR
jgi:hypothetical protein